MLLPAAQLQVTRHMNRELKCELVVSTAQLSCVHDIRLLICAQRIDRRVPPPPPPPPLAMPAAAATALPEFMSVPRQLARDVATDGITFQITSPPNYRSADGVA